MYVYACHNRPCICEYVFNTFFKHFILYKRIQFALEYSGSHRIIALSPKVVTLSRDNGTIALQGE